MEPLISKPNEMLKWRRLMIIWVAPAILLLAVCLSLFKQCTDLGAVARNTVYDPQENGAGFVSKAEAVLNQLLTEDCVIDSIEAISLDALNRRYKALEFALPFGGEGDGYIESSNIRLVGIHPEYIKDEDLKRFYYNSRLPQLLERQAEHLGENYFNIHCENQMPSKAYRDMNPKHILPVTIKSISLIPSMFKVRLTKLPWTGVIQGMPSCIFDQEGTIFLTYGNSVLPIHNDTTINQKYIINFNAIMNEGVLLWTRPTASGHQVSAPEPIDYYEYYKTAFDNSETPHTVNIQMQETRQNEESAHITVSYSNGKLRLSHTCGLLIVGSKKSRKVLNQVSGTDYTEVDFEDGMKILLYTVAKNDLSEKLGEITLFKDNPMRMLSYLTQSSVGKDRFFISDYQTDLFTQQLLHGLSQHLSNRENIDTVSLTIDPLLSREFENEIKAYINGLPNRINPDKHGRKKPQSQVNEQYDMSVTIMDMSTGEVLATPFYTTLFDNNDFPDLLRLTTRNTSLSRRSVGSTFKPMEALASVLSIPSLINLDTSSPQRYANPDFTDSVHRGKVTFFGQITEPWAKKSPDQWGGCNFTTFLSRSDDVYPVGLVALALSDKPEDMGMTNLPIDGDRSYFTTGTDSYLCFKTGTIPHMKPELQPFISNISCLYNVNIVERSDDPIYKRTTDINLFERLVTGLEDEERVFGLTGVSPEPTQLHFDRFDDGEDFRKLLVPWVLGQGDNMWNCVKLAEAWARMISKRDVKASFIHHPDNAQRPSLIGDSLRSFASRPDFNNVWNSFLERLRLAQSQTTSNLLPPMNRTVESLGEDLVLFSKTGTPDAYNQPIDIPLLGGRIRKMDLGQYCFVLTKQSVYENCILNNLPSKGIVCIVRVARSYECDQCKAGKPCEACDKYWGLESAHARDFFSANPSRLRKLYDMTRNYF